MPTKLRRGIRMSIPLYATLIAGFGVTSSWAVCINTLCMCGKPRLEIKMAVWLEWDGIFNEIDAERAIL
ncbi:predicted protein [Sclerotinia sclerotiorum 1980 UF-70]|uniref:Uncharacterized protein n=1 Tax=Sclerotinia sclerotiorum (strain ATCC 18683 / 1980 / Ss-1) TaxID=665079 RepID=A7EQL8_SCLS1|nr:predicted protein [Sclerotinia sclerotiorum 1980 UF-70]EDN91760.1 predicted protein [Sclerotinia sclerotiorum 1980 UF-70]